MKCFGPQVDESHEGEYSCTPYNALGSEGASPPVRVRVQRPPALSARPLPLYLARLGAAITLPCAPRAPHHPTPPAPPAVIWTRVNKNFRRSLLPCTTCSCMSLAMTKSLLQKDGGELPAGRHSLDGGNLTIADIAEEDRGVYLCTVTNEAASVSVETELLIENVPPRAPYNLTAVVSADSVHLSWLPGRYCTLVRGPLSALIC